MRKAIIVDDEQHCQVTLKKILEWNCPGVEVIQTCSSVDEAGKYLSENTVDIVFLDIEMPGKNGFDLLYEMSSLDFDVVFTTAYDEFALEAFKTNAVAYLLKPIDKDELVAAVKKIEDLRSDRFTKEKLLDLYNLMTKSNREIHKVAIPTQEGIEFVRADDIIRCEAEGNYTHIHIKNEKTIFIAKTLKQVELLLKDFHFFRPHNSHLINLKYIKSYSKGAGGSLKMEDDSIVPVSRYRKEDLQNVL